MTAGGLYIGNRARRVWSGAALVALGLATRSAGATPDFSVLEHQALSDGIVYPNDLDAADLDGDGDLDVTLSSSWKAKGYVMLNDGSGAFHYTQALVADRDAPSGGGVARGISIGDTNGDGVSDVIINWSLFGVRIFLGNGLGAFGSAGWYGAYPSTPHRYNCLDSQVSAVGFISACTNGVAINDSVVDPRPANAVAVGDMDNDGVPDVVAVNLGGDNPSTLHVILRGAGAPLMPTLEFEGWVYDVALADLDADGDLDAVSSGGRIFLNDGTGSLTLTEQLLQDQSGTYGGFSVLLADFNDDGSPDIVVGLRQGYWVFFNDGLGGFTGTAYNTGLKFSIGLKEGDFDQDGDLDFAIVENQRYGGFWVAKNTLCDDPDASILCVSADVCVGDPSTGDTDGDGVCDDVDLCAGDDASDDTDGDGVCDDIDLCIGDDATGDSDGDLVCDDSDVCAGDDLLGDTDGDAICDDSDLCPLDPLNDVDGDGVCADMDLCTGDDATGDSDGDQVCDDIDQCEGNDATGDSDADLICDASDNCPSDANHDQADADLDGIGDACEADSDTDGTVDDEDNCVFDYNPDQADSDFDGQGDVCDDDDDNDGVTDLADNCPLLANPQQEDFDADGQGDVCDGDDDADGLPDEQDYCPGTPMSVPYNANGCSGAQLVVFECGGAADHATHGAYLSCVTASANGARDADLLTNKERAAIVRNAAHAD